MRTGWILLLALVQPALASPPAGDEIALTDPPDPMALDVSHGMRLTLESTSLSVVPVVTRTSIFTSLYWSRAYEERARLQDRFGLHWAYGLSFDTIAGRQTPYAVHSPLGYTEDMRWSAKPMAGFQFERHDLFFQGDHLSIRATSDMQALFRESGMLRSSEEVDALSLLGWRSHSTLVWQLGEPSQEIQWQFSARFDRRAYAQTSTANFSLLRRF